MNWATADGTALAGSDYASANGSVTFNPGETRERKSVLVKGDTTYEANETFSIALSAPVNAVIASGGGIGTINNDDAPPPPTATIGNVTLSEGNSGLTAFTFTVTLSGASSQTVSMNWATVDATALAGSDYVSANGSVTFTPGET